MFVINNSQQHQPFVPASNNNQRPSISSLSNLSPRDPKTNDQVDSIETQQNCFKRSSNLDVPESSPVSDYKPRLDNPESDCLDFSCDSSPVLSNYDIKSLVATTTAVLNDPKLFDDLSDPQQATVTSDQVRANSAVDSPILNVTALSPYYKESILIEEDEDEEEEEENDEEHLKVDDSDSIEAVSGLSTNSLLNRSGNSAFSQPSIFSRTSSSSPLPLVAPRESGLTYTSQYQSPNLSSSSCSYAPTGSGLFGLGSTKHLLMPGVSSLTSTSSTSAYGNSSTTTGNSHYSQSPGSFQYPATSASGASNQAELDYLSAFFSTTSASVTSGQSPVSQSLAQSQYAAGAAAASQFDSYLASQRQLPSAASAYGSGSGSFKNPVNGFLTPSLHSSNLFSQSSSLGSQYGQSVNRADTSSPQSPVGSPPTLTPLAPLNPAAAFLHHSAHRQFSPFPLPNGSTSCSSGNLDSGSGSSVSSDPSSTLHPSLASAAAKSTFDHFASPSCLYYLGSHHSSRPGVSPSVSSAGIKRPFLNGIYSNSKRFSASISESSSGDDSGFVSTGSPATDTFPSPHSSPPQLIPPPLSSKQSSLTSSSSSKLPLNLGITSNSASSTSSLASAGMSASPTLPGGQYGHLSDVTGTTTAPSYSYEDFSTLPFSAINSGWSITNLDQATAAAVAAAAVSQSPTLHHSSHPALSLQAAVAPLQQSSLGSVSASTGQPSPTSHLSNASSHASHGHQGSGMMLKDIKMFSNYPTKSAITSAELRIVKQPETHHRARYMTEGSRGTIKDRTGRGYPVVQMIGYNKSPVKLQCFIGHDQKIGEPHLFYQACEVSGKTPYTFVKVDGFNTIELELLPKNNMQAVFDCMGILKERNVDVERKVLRNRRKSASTHRPSVNATEEAKMIRNTNKSRSTHCRMVFRMILPETGEILQTVSDPILCTQPLGSPEIYKMSLREADYKGGVELFVIGKNFHKDSKVIFECQATHWRKVIVPQKEFLNSTHLVCQVPAYDGLNAQCLPLVNVDVSVHCNHKNSDPMKFIYTNGVPTSFSNGSMNSQSSAAVAAAAAYASVCTLRETTTVVANPITGSNTNALFLLERNDVLK